jgi:hypothetical protein
VVGTARAEAVESIAKFAQHVTPTETIDTVPSDPDDGIQRVVSSLLAQSRSI